MMRQDELISAIAEEVIKRLNGKVDKQNGKSLISNSELVRLAGLHNYDDTTVRGLITSEAETRANADSNLSGRITGNANDITAIKGVVDTSNKKIKVATIEKDDNSNQITIADVASFSGQTYFNAKANFGLAAFSNTVDFSGIVTIDNDLKTRLVYPVADDTYDLGKSTNYYKNGYIKKVYTNEIVLGGSSITSTDKTAWDNKVDKVTGKGLSTNDFTDTDKGNISKALYFKGAFDSQDGKTRQSWETVLNGNETWSGQNIGASNAYFYVELPNMSSPVELIAVNVNSTAPTIPTWRNNFYPNDNTGLSITTIDAWKTYLKANPIRVQYKLASSYTDTLIENQSILPLDTNMANKIRQKVVDGLQLLPSQSIVQGSWSEVTLQKESPTIRCRLDYDIPVKPNTTYTVSNTGGRQIAVHQINMSKTAPALVDSAWQNNGYTFTTTANTYWLHIIFKIDDATIIQPWEVGQVMLTDTNHPYPLSSFNQKEHITNNEATLLKQEEEKSRNLSDQTKGKASYVGSFGLKLSSIIDSSYYGKTITLAWYPQNNTTTTLMAISTGSESSGVIASNSNYYITITYSSTYADAGLFVKDSGGWRTLTSVLISKSTGLLMVNVGSSPLPYQEHYGEILHKADVFDGTKINSSLIPTLPYAPRTSYQFSASYNNMTTNINVNAGAGGLTILVLFSAHADTGNSTVSGVGFIRCGYNQNYFSYEHIGGTNPTTHNITFSTNSSGYLTISSTSGYYAQVRFDFIGVFKN